MEPVRKVKNVKILVSWLEKFIKVFRYKCEELNIHCLNGFWKYITIHSTKHLTHLNLAQNHVKRYLTIQMFEFRNRLAFQ